MIKNLLAWSAIPLIILSATIGFHTGKRQALEPLQPLGATELKLSIHNLEHKDDLSPQLREYLKARSYALIAGGIKAEWVNNQFDYGPIDREALGSAVIVKGPSSDEDLYLLAKKVAQSN